MTTLPSTKTVELQPGTKDRKASQRGGDRDFQEAASLLGEEPLKPRGMLEPTCGEGASHIP